MRKLIFLFIFTLLFLFTSSSVFAEQINSFDATININKDGTISVLEKINYDFGSLSRHGIYRTIPTVKTNQNGKKYKLDFQIKSLTDGSGETYNFSPSYQGNDLQLKIGDADRTITSLHEYDISYNMSGALTYFSDHDELYWNITGNDWDVPIEKASATISLPEKLNASSIKLVCFTGYYGIKESNCSFQTDGEKVFFISKAVLASKEGMTIAVGFPKNLVAVLEPQEVIPFFNTFVGKIVLFAIITLAVLWYLLYPLWLILKWYQYGRDPKIFKPVTTWFDPPKNKHGGFLTPGETGALYDERADMRDITATIVDLARRKFLKIEERKKKKLLGSSSIFYLVQSREYLADPSVLLFESRLLSGFFSKNSEIELSQNESLYDTVSEAKNLLYKQTVSDGLFPTNPNDTRNFYTGIMVAAAITLNPLLFASSLIFGRSMSKRTLFGAEQLGIAKSLRNFLSSQERQLKFQADKQMMFEKLLPFAVAFGVEKVWAERFKNLNLQPPEWFTGYQSGTFNSMIFASALSSSMSSFSTAATPVRSSSGFSSGFGGGGFSGGGGGGGGGGSW